mmetsp:Transcript_28743/g.41945  ORF Transcript_28743/g.41945 Transcript_28743/m.41945 type:complete len:404 (+) Transcript_28743:42-1253(+)
MPSNIPQGKIMDRLRSSIIPSRSANWHETSEVPMAFSDKSVPTESTSLLRQILQHVTNCITCPFRVLPTVLVSSVPFLVLLYGLRGFGPPNGSTSTEEVRCQLQKRFMDGSFLVGSHRSFVDSMEQTQPTCKAALIDLRSYGVRYFDIDLVYGPHPDDADGASEKKTLYLAHPMEYFKTSTYNSPCSLTPLSDFLELLNTFYNDSDDNRWYITMEPKASWGGNTQKDDKKTMAPATEVLAALLDIAQEHDLQPSQCALIILPGQVRSPKESHLVSELKKHCDLDLAIKLTDLESAMKALTLSGFEYQYVMPTIEFHPDHQSHPDEKTVGEKNDHKLTTSEALEKIRNTVPNAIFWIIDTRKDLQMAASLDAYGIVSNRPHEVVKWITDDKWCSTESNHAPTRR